MSLWRAKVATVAVHRQAVRWHMGADVSARGSTGTALKAQPPPLHQQAPGPALLGREARPEAPSLHRKEPKARRIEQLQLQ